MKKVNLLDIENNLEDIVMMKMDVESLQEGNKKPFNEFMSNLQVSSTIFVHNGTIIPFTIVNGATDTYFVHCASPYDSSIVGEQLSKKITEAMSVLDAKLADIGYDFSKLSKKSVVDMVNLGVDVMNSATYFIINDEYYI